MCREGKAETDMKKVLIQLVGKQTMPNIISLLSVVPDEVVHIYTKTTKERHEDIVRWCSKHGWNFGLSPVFPPMDPVSERFEELIPNLGALLTGLVEKCRREEDTLLILNATGATKPMSAMSMSICQGLEQKYRRAGEELAIPIFYVNTDTKSFDFFAHKEMRGEVLAHEAFTRRMTVRQIIDATARVELKGYRDWRAAYPAAKMFLDWKSGFNLVNITDSNAEQMVQLGICAHRAGEQPPEGGITKLERFVQEAGKDPAVVKGLASCGFEWRDGDFHFNKKLKAKAAEIGALKRKSKGKAARTRIQALLSEIQDAQNFWVGGWWEVIVAHACKTHQPDSEVLWSVGTADRKTGEAGVETDVITTDGFSLRCISCKRGMHKKVVQELEQHCARTVMLGGVTSRRVMAMYYKDVEMYTLTRVLNIQLWLNKTVQAMEEGTTLPTPDEVAAEFQHLEKAAAAETEEAKPMGLGRRLAAAWRILACGRRA